MGYNLKDVLCSATLSIISAYKNFFNEVRRVNMNSFKIGDIYRSETTVDESMLACSVGSGSLRVYSTPMVVALIERAASQMAQTFVEEGITTVGTSIDIAHISATPVGARVWAEARLKDFDGRKFIFDVKAFDKKGLIAEGEHERCAVNCDKFQKRADGKFSSTTA